MATLIQRGYARRLPSRRYALGPRLIHLGEEIVHRRAGACQRGALPLSPVGKVLKHRLREPYWGRRENTWTGTAHGEC